MLDLTNLPTQCTDQLDGMLHCLIASNEPITMKKPIRRCIAISKLQIVKMHQSPNSLENY